MWRAGGRSGSEYQGRDRSFPPGVHRRDLDQDQHGPAQGLGAARPADQGQGAARSLEDHDLPGRAAPRSASMRHGSSTDRSTARASSSMSRRFSCRPSSPATSSSWTISARTKARPCAAPSERPAPGSSCCPNTRPTSTPSKALRQAQALAAQGRQANRRDRLRRHRPNSQPVTPVECCKLLRKLRL